MRKLDYKKESERIYEFIRQQMKKSGFTTIVIGLSGGIDSAVTAALSVKALGKEHVFGLMMPYRKSHPNSLRHARELCTKLEIKYKIIDISVMIDAYFNVYEPQADRTRRGNKMARERMSILYDYSAKMKALVAGTGNLSELMVGYCTQYGDNACAFEPIGHLYKTEVIQLAYQLTIPESIITKAPTADLWENQTDETELGIRYEKLDQLLFNLFEQRENEAQLIEKGFNQTEIERVKQMHLNSEFKRQLPPLLKEGVVQ